MEDIERYGDYNEVDETPGGNKSPVILIIKILICALCICVVGILAFRLILFNYYPKSIKNIYFNEKLDAHYDLVGDDFYAKTQTLRAPYDDPDVASFFCDNLIVIEAAGQLQVSVRYNSSVFDTIKEKYGVELDPNAEDLFSFSLERIPYSSGSEKKDPYEIGTLSYSHTEEVMMYTYYKLVFDDIEASHFEDGSWIRLVIALNGVEDAKPYYVLVYENTEEYNGFKEYEVKSR